MAHLGVEKIPYASLSVSVLGNKRATPANVEEGLMNQELY